MTMQPTLFPDETASHSGAELSPCGTYRYRLWRTWDASRPPVCWVMPNPSTADAETDDATIRKCMTYARTWGHGGIVVVNLFAYRATSPAVMKAAREPVGPLNDPRLLEEALGASLVVCAWGTDGSHQGRGEVVRRLLTRAGVGLHYLTLTKDGQPGHPLYLPGSLRPREWL